MTTAPARSPQDYVLSLDLPEAEPRLEAIEEAPEFTDTRQAVTVGAQLTEFSEAVPSNVRAAIADSILLAQLAASKAASQSEDVFSWYGKYTEVLQKIGWQMRDLDFQTQRVTDANAGVHQAIIPVLTAMLGPAVAAISMVIAVLEGLHKMDESTPWITLFDQKSEHARGAKFQISYVDANAQGDPEISLLCFAIEAEREITQVLFFKFSGESAEIKKAAGKLAVNMARLQAAHEAISKRVEPFVADYVKNIEI